MGLFKKLLLLLLCSISLNCSKSDESDQNGLSDENSLVRYEDLGESENQLTAEIFMSTEGSTTYIYGDINSLGEMEDVSSVAYQSKNDPAIVYHFLLDDQHRVREIFSTTSGIKDSKVYVYAYPEGGLVNVIVKERDWSTGEDEILSFTSIELEEDQFIASPPTQNKAMASQKDSQKIQDDSPSPTSEWLDVIAHNIGMAAIVGGIAIGGFVVAGTYGVAAGVIAALVWVGAAFAEEPPSEKNSNSEAPLPPAEFQDQCADSMLEVVLGLDPGNEATAIVNGNSDEYTFYWSTGVVETASIAHTTTVPEEGAYYVMVVDDNGCLAFASGGRQIQGFYLDNIFYPIDKDKGFVEYTDGVENGTYRYNYHQVQLSFGVVQEGTSPHRILSPGDHMLEIGFYSSSPNEISDGTYTFVNDISQREEGFALESVLVGVNYKGIAADGLPDFEQIEDFRSFYNEVSGSVQVENDGEEIRLSIKLQIENGSSIFCTYEGTIKEENFYGNIFPRH